MVVNKFKIDIQFLKVFFYFSIEIYESRLKTESLI